MPFPISLAQWSLHRTFEAGVLDPIDIARIARETYNLDAVEYVNRFFRTNVRNPNYLAELKKRADDHGVKSLLIMVDREGDLGHPDPAERRHAVANHQPWLDAAAFLGCHSIRVNARSAGFPEDQARLVAEGLRALTEIAASMNLNVLVENHGGLSSNGQWLAGVIRLVDHPACGTLPDFGNFWLEGNRHYDRYQGVTELMPFAKAVSAKSNDFNAQGDEIHTDYPRMLRIVLNAGYRGHIGIEYEGSAISEHLGITLTKNLLEQTRTQLAPEFP